MTDVNKYRPPLGMHYWNDGEWVHPYGVYNTTTLNVPEDSIYFLPIVVPFEISVTHLGLHWGEGSDGDGVGTAKLALYTYDYNSLNQDIELISQTGNISVPRFDSFRSVSLSLRPMLSPGIYYLAIYSVANIITVRTIDRNRGSYTCFVNNASLEIDKPFTYFSIASLGGSLPETIVASTLVVNYSDTSLIPYVAMKIINRNYF